MHLQVVLAGQVLTGQGRSKSFSYFPGVLLPQQLHYLRSKLLRLSSIRLFSPALRLLQSLRAFLVVSPPDPLQPAGSSDSGSLPQSTNFKLFTRPLGPALPTRRSSSFCSSMSFPAKTSSGGFSLGDISNDGHKGTLSKVARHTWNARRSRGTSATRRASASLTHLRPWLRGTSLQKSQNFSQRR